MEISELVADRVADLRGWDMIVVNAASGPQAADTSAAQAGLTAALDRGLGVLAVHVGACTLLRLPEWESVTGAAWISGRSMHPKVGPGRIITYPGRHPICAPVADFDITDERYAYLRTAPEHRPAGRPRARWRTPPAAVGARAGEVTHRNGFPRPRRALL